MGPSGSMTSMVGKSVFLQGLHQILFHQPHDIDFPANGISQSVPAQSPRLLVRAHKTKSQIHVQFLRPPPTRPSLKFGEDFLLSAKTPGLCQPATQRDTFVFE